MIFNAIASILTTILTGLLDLLPDLPDIPTAVSNSGDWMITFVSNLSGIVGYILSPALMQGVIAVAIALIVFEPAYHLFIWLLRKLPISIH